MAKLKEFLYIVLLVVLIVVLLDWAFGDEAHAASKRNQCDTNHPVVCHQAIAFWKGKAHKAERAVQWQHDLRIKQVRNVHGYGVDHAIRIAAALYGIPRWQLDSVISCESGHDPSVISGHPIGVNPNTTPRAVGLAQWLLGSWNAQGLPGFSRVDPYASVLAMGRAVSRNGSFRQWVCKPTKG